METKLCTTCKQEKEIDFFYSKRFQCKNCILTVNKKYREINKDKIKAYKDSIKDKIKIDNKLRRIKNKEKYSLYEKEYRNKNKEKIKLEIAIYRKKNKEAIKNTTKKWTEKNKERHADYQKKYREENRLILNKKAAIYQTEKRAKSPMYKLKATLRQRIYDVFIRIKQNKNAKTEDILGTDFNTAKKHIERQFKKGMNWGNHGKWHIDHKIPLALAKTEEELKKLCHYTNLQPLWAKENLTKNDKIVPTQMTLTI